MNRAVSLRVAVVMGAVLLLIRLAHLQLVRGSHYAQLAEQNRTRLVPEQAPRGMIVDRHGCIIATNQTVYRVALVPQELSAPDAVLTRLSALLRRPVATLTRDYKKARTLAFVPATIVSRVPKEVAIHLEEERWRLPGVMVKAETVRHYPLGSSAAHLLGYLGQPTAEELPLLKAYGIKPQYLVGRYGLERLLDHALQGRPGGVMVEVNHRARQVRVMGERLPEPGARVVLTVDAELEGVIEQAFAGQTGAAVVLDPESGAVLAMVSVPSFLPEAFVVPQPALVQQYLEDPQAPLMNRATTGIYLPGSIMKLVTAAAMLEHHIATPQHTVVCQGGLRLGDRTIHCWNRDGHGSLDLRGALRESCNVYFMTMGRRMGFDRLSATQRQVGFTKKTGWLMDEQAGFLQRRRPTEGDLAHLAIGQGEVSITPLQAAVMVSIFANGGSVVQPYVIETIGDRPFPHPRGKRPVGWSPATIASIREGMNAVINDPGGTGWRAHSPLISVAGKTGTAQTGVPGQTHAWFVGYCPADHPKAALAIVAEFGGSGGDLPAEVARLSCEYLAASQPAQVAHTPSDAPVVHD